MRKLRENPQPRSGAFLFDWCERMRPMYMAVSLPDTFLYPSETVGNRILTDAVLPACLELNLPLSLMIGVRLQLIQPCDWLAMR